MFRLALVFVAKRNREYRCIVIRDIRLPLSSTFTLFLFDFSILFVIFILFLLSLAFPIVARVNSVSSCLSATVDPNSVDPVAVYPSLVTNSRLAVVLIGLDYLPINSSTHRTKRNGSVPSCPGISKKQKSRNFPPYFHFRKNELLWSIHWRNVLQNYAKFIIFSFYKLCKIRKIEKLKFCIKMSKTLIFK